MPVLPYAPQIEWPGVPADPRERGAWECARRMVRAHGPQVLCWFTLARWACIPFSLLGAWICFRWAGELYGSRAGLTAAVLWCFSPTILGHAPLITPDVGSAAVGAAAGYLFWRWLKEPSFGRASAAGVVLGLAQLTKFTWVILFGLWPLLWLVWRVAARLGETQSRGPASPRPGARLGDTRPREEAEERGQVRWLREAGQIALVIVVAVYVINLGYGFEGTGARLDQLRFISPTLRDSPSATLPDSIPRPGNRFAGTLWGRLPIPVPANYLLGIDRQKYDFDEAGFWSYLGGQWRQGGWWYYYLYALAIKEPLGTWLLSSRPVAGLGEIALPPRQAGSSIMPGKVNPVIPEAVGQAALSIVAHDQALTSAASLGNLELNQFLPLIAADESRCRRAVAAATATVTALVDRIGYEAAEAVARAAQAEGKTVRQVVLEQGLLTADQFDQAVAPDSVTRLGSVHASHTT